MANSCFLRHKEETTQDGTTFRHFCTPHMNKPLEVLQVQYFRRPDLVSRLMRERQQKEREREREREEENMRKALSTTDHKI